MVKHTQTIRRQSLFPCQTVLNKWNQIIDCQDKIYLNYYVKDTHREEAPSNKIPTLTKSTNMGIWFVGTSNQLIIRGS